ncbi:hypothetical protein VOM14_23585 [Paraburkholderia sp. MPAMCS5]|nr:hypothetical protein [Paraburkholderia sp. MPAMCS5]
MAMMDGTEAQGGLLGSMRRKYFGDRYSQGHYTFKTNKSCFA